MNKEATSSNSNLYLQSKKRKRDDIKSEEENSPEIGYKNINEEKYTIQFLNKNPIFKYHSDILHTNDGNFLNNKFEAYYSYRDKKLYLVSPNHFNYQLYIFNLNYNRIIKKLKGHSFFITSIKYFFNQLNKKEYLLSSDRNKWVILWDINNNFDKKVIINTKYKYNYIYSCLILFNISNNYNNYCLNISNNKSIQIEDNINSYIIISSNNLANNNENKESTNIYLLDNGSFIKTSYNNNTNNLLSWLNKKDNKEFVIELCSDKIIIYNIFDKDIYYEFKNGNNYMSGFIKSENEDFLYSNSIEKYIYIYNLNQKILVKTINVEGWSLYKIIEWDERYLIIIDSYKKVLKIIDIKQGKVISCLSNIHSVGITSLKKITHPVYGESLLTCGKDNKIKLWILK